MRPPRSSKTPLVLLVDDDALLREMGRDALEQAGFAVALAASAEEALRRFREEAPDLVLLDLELPDRDGFSLCQELRRQDDNPVLMVTARDDAEAVRRAYEAGATDFTIKPVQWTILCQRIRAVLRAAGAAAELRRSQERLDKVQRVAKFAYWELDLKTGVVCGAEPLHRLYGIENGEAEMGYEVLLGRVHPEDRALLRAAAERAVREGEPLYVDHRVPLRGGGERILNLQADVLRDDLGRPATLSGTAQDVTERRRVEEEARFATLHDRLTRLANRQLFSQQVEQALALARRHKGMVAVLFLDLDHFKRINETLGHRIGDGFLQSVAERLQNCVRECDFVSRPIQSDGGLAISRFGGDEFMISLNSLEAPGDAGRVAERILRSLSLPFDVGGESLVVTASIGIALAPRDGADADTLIGNAGAAMYHAKEAGRGVYRFFERSMNELAQNRLRLESDLRRALENEELFLHYQPKIEIESRRVTGFEALVRWRHPTLGLVPPVDFVAVAEQAGLVTQLGEFVLRSACAQARDWRESGLPPLRMAVNFSAHQFRSESLTASVIRIVRETPMSPRQLDVEITESAMMESQRTTLDVLRELKGIGISVSLDDFGTGYSSLGYLKGFPVDTIKIDRSFIRDVTSDPDDAALTAAIISMAKALSLRVVAEGVETEEQLAFLRGHRCDEVQGYLFSRPMPAEEATEYLRRNLAIR
jgi:diguanylate cyclase (GGDEF)-like protein/PAS domain S-box-containing protein